MTPGPRRVALRPAGVQPPPVGQAHEDGIERAAGQAGLPQQLVAMPPGVRALGESGQHKVLLLEGGASHKDLLVSMPSGWGQMINTGMNFMYFYWHMAVFPTAALALTVLATTLFGDGLRDALEPWMKK